MSTRNDFTILNEESKLPSFSTLMDKISRHRKIAEGDGKEEPGIEEKLTRE